MNKILSIKIFLWVGINLLLISIQLQAQISDELRLEIEKKLTSEVSEQSQESLIDKWRRQRENAQAKGVILGFHKWPNRRQERIIVNYLKKSGLKKVNTIDRFKIWIFDWVNTSSQETSEYLLKPLEESLNVCKNFPKVSILRYCEANSLTYPAGIDQNNIAEQTEGRVVCIGMDCFEPLGDQEISILSDVVNETNRAQESCKFIPSKQGLMNSTLSDYWAQELIGSDLLREELEKFPAPDKENYVAVFDSRDGNNLEDDLDSHAVKVRNLISDEGIHAVLPELESKVRIFETDFLEENPETVARLLGATDKLPSFINSSLGWMGNESTYQAFQSLSPPAILVAASGNNFPAPLGKMRVRASKKFDAILVGSFSPEGFISYFSSSGEEVHIVVPSDNILTSATADGDYVKFAGTSGAGPLGTGSLAAFEWFSDYHPTAKEAKLLLENTAVPTLHSHEEPQINGVGLLNAYKLGMVGKRLRGKCPNKEISCFQREINNEANYEFTIDDKQLKKDVASAFPGCNDESISNEDVITDSCENKKKVFKKLRQAVLLVPDRRGLWETLSCVYKSEGFSQNAEMLNKIALSIDNREKVLHELKNIIVNDEKVENKASAILLIRNIAKEDSSELLQQFSKSSNPSIRGALAIASVGMGEDGLRFLNKLSRDPEVSVKKNVAVAAGRIKGKEGLKIFRKLSKDPEIDVRMYIVTIAENLGGQFGLEILHELLKDPEKNVRMSIVTIAGEMEGKFGLAILREFLDDPEEEVKMNVVAAAEKIGGDGSLEILRNLSEDDNREIRKEVAIYAAKMMKKKNTTPEMKDGLLSILRKLSKDDDEYVRSIVDIAIDYIEKDAGVELFVDSLQDSETVRE